MEKFQLKAKKRTLTGRKVKQLRKQGLLPGNIYGNKIKSQAVEISVSDFKQIFKKVGETKIVDLLLSDKDVHPVLIHNLQTDPLTGNPLHADFYQVNLKEKVKTKVPVTLVGISSAVVQKLGLLLQTLNEVEVEALPTDLPEKIEIDVTPLTVLDQELKVANLKITKGVTVLTDSNLVVVKVGKLVSKEAEELAKEEEAAAAAAKAAAATEAPVTGEVPPTTQEKAPLASETAEKTTTAGTGQPPKV